MSRKPYSPQTGKSQTKATEESKKKSSLLKDNSWIRKDDSEDKSLNQDPNYGRALLSRYRSSEKLDSTPDKTSTVASPTQTSVQALSKRFSTSQDELDSNRSPVKSNIPNIRRMSKTTVAEEPQTSITTTTIQDLTKTTVTTTRTSLVKSPTKSETFTEKVVTDAKTAYKGKSQTESSAANSELPTKSSSAVSQTEIITVTTTKETSNLQNNKTDNPPVSTLKTTTSTVTYDVPTSKTASSISSKSRTEEQLFDSPMPTKISLSKPPPATISYEKSSVTSPTTYTRSLSRESRSDDYLPDTWVSIKSVSSTPDRYDRLSSVKGSTTTYTTYSEGRPEDYLADTFTSKTVKTVYTTPERKVTEKDICTYCHKPMLCETKMILDDVNIKCHASCFKCEVCNSPLGHLKAGDSMWIYRRTVHCENCYGVTREKWHR